MTEANTLPRIKEDILLQRQTIFWVHQRPILAVKARAASTIAEPGASTSPGLKNTEHGIFCCPAQMLLNSIAMRRPCIIQHYTLLLLLLINQGQITHNLRLGTHIHMQFRHVRSFSLAARFLRAKTPKVRGAINMLSLDFPSVAG